MPSPQSTPKKRRPSLLGRIFSGSSSSPRDELGLTRTTLRLVPAAESNKPSFAVFQTRMLTREYDSSPSDSAATAIAEDESSAKLFYAPVRLPQRPLPRIKIHKPDDIPFQLRPEEIWPDWWTSEPRKVRSEEEDLENRRKVWRSARSYSFTPGEEEVISTKRTQPSLRLRGIEEGNDRRRQHAMRVKDDVPLTPPESPVDIKYRPSRHRLITPVCSASTLNGSDAETIQIQISPSLTSLVRTRTIPRSNSTSSSVSSSSSGPSRKDSLVRTSSVVARRRKPAPDVGGRIATEFAGQQQQARTTRSYSLPGNVISPPHPLTPPVTPPTPTIPNSQLVTTTAKPTTQEIVNGMYTNTSNGFSPPSSAGYTLRSTQFPPAIQPIKPPHASQFTSQNSDVHPAFRHQSDSLNYPQYHYMAYNSPPPRPAPERDELDSPVSELSSPTDSIVSNMSSISVTSSIASTNYTRTTTSVHASRVRKDSLGWESITEVCEPEPESPSSSGQENIVPEVVPEEDEQEYDDEEEEEETPQTPVFEDAIQRAARLKRMREMVSELQAENEKKAREREMEMSKQAKGVPVGGKAMVIRRKPVFSALQQQQQQQQGGQTVGAVETKQQPNGEVMVVGPEV